MRRFALTLAGALTLIVCAPLPSADAQSASPRRWSSLLQYNQGFYSPSTYGYNLGASTGYYGGMNYREYYSYGRGAFGIADMPPPVPGHKYYPHDLSNPWNWIDGAPAQGTVVVRPAAPADAVAVTSAGVGYLDLQVPADAQVWLEGVPMPATGSKRHFVSPPLAAGQKYVYDVKASWTKDGKTVDQRRRVEITAGGHVSVRFPLDQGVEQLGKVHP